jgi:two-component system, NtrC family, response regulator HydG
MKAKILVVDDEENMRSILEETLNREGHEVFTSGNYSSALNIISREIPDLIFADVVLGSRTGIEILSEIRNMGIKSPVIMITGNPSIDSASDAVRLGAFDYLPKPIRKDQLLRATKLALDHKALMDEKRLMEEEKERIRNNLEAIFRSVNDGIITVNKDMMVIDLNEATEKICPIMRTDIIGKPLSQFPSNKCSRTCHKILNETLENHITTRDSRIECRLLDNPEQVVAVTSSLLMDNNGKPIGAVLVLRDLTRITDLERELRERHLFHNIIGKSKRMQEIYNLLQNLATTDTTVLVTGESGTGKELIARALHYSGSRAFKPFVTVNCSALAENLLESELFGHVKGSFTGALKDKIGRFQAADKGTIFLDEIGDISHVIQLKLLRVLQEKEFEKVGDSTPVKVDVRIIASTNRQLKERVRMGEFREDLYYRLKVVEVVPPPLRERREDIPLLIKHFCANFNKRFNKEIEGVTDEVVDAFMRYLWPGNIRELEHAIEHSFVLCHGKNITLDHIPMEIVNYSGLNTVISGQTGKIQGNAGNIVNQAGLNRAIIDEYIESEVQGLMRALEKTAWNKAKAARLLGISRQTIYRKIKENNIIEPM